MKNIKINQIRISMYYMYNETIHTFQYVVDTYFMYDTSINIWFIYLLF